MNNVRVRFAPSPTGYLHIGGARTAILNWLFAKKHSGKFLIRIEDTDQDRSSDAMVKQIINSLSWLELKHNENIYFQSQHIKEHLKITEKLLESGKAYRCFCKNEDIKKKKQRAIQEKKSDKYDRTCLNINSKQIEHNLKTGLPYAIRLKIDEGDTVINDMIIGEIKIQNDEIDDFVIVRSDGTPIYQLAVVSDDNNMGITHIIRGNDHLTNTAKQIQIYKAMNWQIPHFAHLPLIMGEDKKRLSKRHGATSVEEFRDKGILSDALFNYLALLGWSVSEENEIFTRKKLIEKFSLEEINKKSAIFDEKKLLWINSQYISEMNDEDILAKLKEKPQFHEINHKDEQYILKTISLLKNKIKNIDEFFQRGFYFFKAPINFDEKGIKKYFKNESTKKWIEMIIDKWHKNVEFNPEQLENELRNLAGELDISAGKIIHPIRLIVTGSTVSPSLFEMLQHIGKHEVIKRINQFLDNYNEIIKM